MKRLKGLFLIGCASMMISVTPAIASERVNGGSIAIDGNNVMPLKTETVDSGQGEWSYGTGIAGLSKSAYSNLNHKTKVHRSSCSIDDNYNRSDWKPARQLSESYVTGPLNATAYCNWDVQ